MKFEFLLIAALCLVLFCVSCGIDTAEHLSQGEESLEAGEVDRARSHFERILRKYPEFPEAVAGMLEASVIASATEDQLHWSRELLVYRPWHRKANLILGKRLLDEGNLKDAVIRFTLAFQNSTFQSEKKEAIDLLQAAVIQTQSLDATPSPTGSEP